MSEQSYTHAASMSKPKAPNIPTTGIYRIEEWAEAFEITEHQFRKWIKQYRIPYFQPGQRFYLKAEDVWDSVPRINHRTPPKEN